MRGISSPRETGPIDHAGRGSDLVAGPVEQVSLERLSGAKLAFAGRRIARHWQRLPWGEVLTITLWARQKAGFVVAFDTFENGAVVTRAAGVDTVEDAVCFLEDHCTRLPEFQLQTDRIVQSLLLLQRAASFQQAFLALVGEALAAWIDLPERPGHKSRDKATA